MGDLNDINAEISKLMSSMSDKLPKKKSVEDILKEEKDNLDKQLSPEQKQELDQNVAICKEMEAVFNKYNPSLKDCMSILVGLLVSIVSSTQDKHAREAAMEWIFVELTGRVDRTVEIKERIKKQLEDNDGQER